MPTHTSEYELVHHDGMTTWRIKDLSLFLQRHQACVEALEVATKVIDELYKVIRKEHADWYLMNDGLIQIGKALAQVRET